MGADIGQVPGKRGGGAIPFEFPDADMYQLCRMPGSKRMPGEIGRSSAVGNPAGVKMPEGEQCCVNFSKSCLCVRKMQHTKENFTVPGMSEA